MGSVTVNLDGDALRDATVQAMLGVLTPEVKAKVLENAITALIAPSTNSYDKKKSQFEMAFETAIMQVAKEEVSTMVKEDLALRARIQDLLRVTADKVLNSDVDKLAERMATSFAESMRKDY